MAREHLTGPELEDLLLEWSGGGDSRRDARAHCEECSQCGAMVRAHRTAMGEIESLRHLTMNTEHPDCPPQAQWLNLAAGLSEEGEAMQLLEHASQCWKCAQLFRQSQEYMVAPSESLESLSLKSSSTEWQRQMAGQMAARPAAIAQIPKKARSRWFMPTLVAAAACVVVAVALIVINRPPDVDKLLAQAYSQERTLELRIPRAAYSDLKQQRAAGQKSLIGEDPLGPPKDAINALCKGAPDSNECLLDKANLDLLAGLYQPALQELASIHASSESREFLLARALAEFEKGEIEGQSRTYESTYGQAVEDLSKALKINPHDPVALYNRAFIFEKLFMFDSAISDWEELLKVETDAGWKADARRHLDALREKKNTRLENLKRLTDPQQAAQEVLRSQALNPQQTEAFLDIAVNQWIVPAKTDSALAPKLLNKLARAIQENHQDDWLTDFLSAPESPEGVSLLRAAIRANASGDIAGAERAAQSAMQLFRRAGNAPGAAQSCFELLYALRPVRKQTAVQWLEAARLLRSSLSHRRYSWLDTRFTIEAAKYQGIAGNFDAAQSLADGAFTQAGPSVPT